MKHNKIIDQSGYSDYNTVMSFNEFLAIQDKMQQRNNARRTKDRKNRITYYKRQRIFGITIMTVGMLILLLGFFIGSHVTQLFGAVIGFVGLYITVTKQMVLVDSYYLECQDRMYNGR